MTNMRRRRYESEYDSAMRRERRNRKLIAVAGAIWLLASLSLLPYVMGWV